MLRLSVRVGQAVRIGDVAVVRVDHKSGQAVALVLDSDAKPIRILQGAIPRLRDLTTPAAPTRRRAWGLKPRRRRYG